MTAKTLMVQGTMSSVGKSWVVTALCRYYARQGVRVAPFKAQNMSNNAAVCADGGEIGRAQFTQALAAMVEPTVAMNPVLLKPEADARSQVVVMGRRWETLTARSYYERKQLLWEQITAAFDQLRNSYDLIIIEGAGSPVELNLKAGDLVNMAVARYARSPVLLVGDIDRGGIFAQMLGTLDLLEPEEQTLVRGLLVNRFRGDISLFDDGVAIMEQRGGVPVLGVIPYMHRHNIPEEDAVAVEDLRPLPPSGIDIAVLRLPRIANFDDFDPLNAEMGVNVRYVETAASLGQPNAVIIPGTKSTMADLTWLRDSGLADAVVTLAQEGTPVIGICGGYQMLGSSIYDPKRTEANQTEMDGLGLLPVTTTFVTSKTTHQVRAQIGRRDGWLNAVRGQVITGYEIHMGQTNGAAPWLTIDRQARQSDQPNQTDALIADGSMSEDGRIWGCYLHGLFFNDDLRRAWLRSLGWRDTGALIDDLNTAFDRVADHVAAAVAMRRLSQIVGL